jgi:protein-S-isoprenylcysteine O-methyltransferase Ste14
MARFFGSRCSLEGTAGAQGGEVAADSLPRRPTPLRAFFAAIVTVAAIGLAVPDGGVAEAVGAWAWLGLVPLAAGPGFMHWAAALFRAAGTTVKPFQPASRLVTHGAFDWSRHPMYLGMLLILAGLAMITGSPLALLACVPFALYMQRTFMLPEEWRLESQFRHEYREYRQRVGRWVSLPLG